MDIAIIPGATVAVIRIKIKAKVTDIDTDIDTYTKWKLLYKPIYNHNYFETEELQYNSSGVYGYGPLFYDLTNLEPNTKYCIKLVITECDESINIRETSEKSFTTCDSGDFVFKVREYKNSSHTEEQFNNILNWFEDCMIASGYNYNITNDRTEEPFNDNIASPKVIADEDYLSLRGAGGMTSNKGNITLRYFNINDDYHKSIIVHEFRHFLGLSDGGIQYHGDCWHGYGTWHRTGYGSGYGYFPQAIEYYNNICKVTSFSRGVDSEDMEIYMYYGENSVDSMYIPQNSGWRYLGFMLLKALGLNDIYIAYNEYPTYYDYEINVSPSNISNISYTWYEKDDDDNLVSIENETNNSIHTTLETIWVKVTADGYEEETVELDKDNRTKSITIESSNVVIDAFPLITGHFDTSADKYRMHGENFVFPVVIYNSGNRNVDYNLGITNTNNSQQFSQLISQQINIGNAYSVIICKKVGYGSGGGNSMIEQTGTFTINGNKVNTPGSFKIYTHYGSEHSSRVRSDNNLGVDSAIQFVPYSLNGSLSYSLKGLADAAAEINGNKIYFYDNRHEEPVDCYEYVCNNTYKKTIYASGGVDNSISFDFDGTDMLTPSNMSITIGRLYSDFTYSINTNSSNGIRMGVVSLGYGEENSGVYSPVFMSTIFQESPNLKFMFASSNETFLDLNYNLKNGNVNISIMDLSEQQQYTATCKYLVFLSDLNITVTANDSNDNPVNITKVSKSQNQQLRYVVYKPSDTSITSCTYTVTINNN